jgi:hypothetical protein
MIVYENHNIEIKICMICWFSPRISVNNLILSNLHICFNDAEHITRDTRKFWTEVMLLYQLSGGLDIFLSHCSIVISAWLSRILSNMLAQSVTYLSRQVTFVV